MTDCPVCGAPGLEPDTFNIPVPVKPGDIGGPHVFVEGLEFCWCNSCKNDPAFPDQIRRNQERIAAARAAHSAGER